MSFGYTHAVIPPALHCYINGFIKTDGEIQEGLGRRPVHGIGDRAK